MIEKLFHVLNREEIKRSQISRDSSVVEPLFSRVGCSPPIRWEAQQPLHTLAAPLAKRQRSLHPRIPNPSSSSPPIRLQLDGPCSGVPLICAALRLFRSVCCAKPDAGPMERARLTPFPREQATTRMCMVSSFATELLEMKSKEPSLQVLVIPGNPGIVAFYKDFVEALYENLGGQASITAIGHISHSQKDAEHGRLFSLHEQINHKVDFIEEKLEHSEQPIVLVGHSIGAYIGLEIFKRLQTKIIFFVGLYPFLTLNKNSVKQSAIGYIARSSLLSKGVSSFVSLIGSLQALVRRGIVTRLLGPSWSVTAVDAACYHLLRYHTMRNVLFMAMTEFEKLTEEPNWTFIRARQNEIALLFGVDDHWGPLSHLEEVSKRAPGVVLTVETEGHTHGYCCTEAGSFWVADYVANLIKTQMLSTNN